jgi:ribosome assembly protein YihI (activator of Der GTPase)
MQRLDLMDQLDELIVSLEAASGLSKLDILDSIDAVMQKLGLGNTGDNPSPEPESHNQSHNRSLQLNHCRRSFRTLRRKNTRGWWQTNFWRCYASYVNT